MAGIYIHIPFCKKACHYCDFHFSTQRGYEQDLINAIVQEVNLQKNYLSGESIDTIYFGGGTPSILTIGQIEEILSSIYTHFNVNKDVEITLEGNPDDLELPHLKNLFKLGVNRLSIGIQSFDDEELKMLNRAHNAKESITAIEEAKEAGFDNITIDLMYGLPAGSLATWEHNLSQMLALDVPHLSAYCLTIEPNTVFGKWHNSGKLPNIEEEESIKAYHLLVETLIKNGYDHYEISNFAKPDRYSKHNSNYWKFVPYLGIGPSAHSFDTKSRQYNISNNHQYMKAIQSGSIPSTIENLSVRQLANDYLLTSLRTQWGCDYDFMEQKLGFSLWGEHQKQIDEFVQKGWLKVDQKTIFLTQNGKLIADTISAELFMI